MSFCQGDGRLQRSGTASRTADVGDWSEVGGHPSTLAVRAHADPLRGHHLYHATARVPRPRVAPRGQQGGFPAK